MDDIENEEDYIIVNLQENTEAYTAYEGGPIWQAIYNENCNYPGNLVGSDQTCSEQSLLYQLMSGLHSSINTHVSHGFEDKKGNQFSNMTYFNERIGQHEDRIKNLHLIYAVVLKAVSLIEPAILKQSFSSVHKEEIRTKDLAFKLINQIQLCDEPFKESELYFKQDPQLLNQLQHKFYNISRIIDCTVCDKCRLNGKVQVRGLATALKVIFLDNTQVI